MQEARMYMDASNFHSALSSYNRALEIAYVLPGVDEHVAKLLSNRSLALFKIGKLDEALADALNCISHFPNWIKVGLHIHWIDYWYASISSIIVIYISILFCTFTDIPLISAFQEVFYHRKQRVKKLCALPLICQTDTFKLDNNWKQMWVVCKLTVHEKNQLSRQNASDHTKQ